MALYQFLKFTFEKRRNTTGMHRLVDEQDSRPKEQSKFK